MKYYLLTFNEDWADEHNVPALGCFTEEQYNNWLAKEFGELNPKYEEQLVNYNAWKKAKDLLEEEVKAELGDNWLSIRFTEWPKELYERYNNFDAGYGYKNSWGNYPKKTLNHDLYAQLGNNGDCFNENFIDCFTGQDFVDNKHVSVSEVPESFYNVFAENNLSYLSLCNVFD